MPLSEREQKILDEMEKGLANEDPRFADKPRSVTKPHAGRVRLGALIFLLGLGLLIFFFVSRVLFAGLLAFGAMVTGIVLLASPVGALMHSTKQDAGRKRESLKRSVSDFDDTMRKRFRRH